MKIKVSFLGAAENVTGSRFLVEVNGTKILIDCGLYQERQLRDRNWDPFPVPPSQINAMLLTHAHLDHCGLIPKLVREGFNGPVYCTDATAEIARIVLLDAAELQEEDAAYKAKRHRREGRSGPHEVKPLYDSQDALNCENIYKTTKYEKTVEIAEGITASFHEAGHILGAAMIMLNITVNGQKRSILFSGDVGRWNRPIIKDPTLFEHADYVLVESTYGDRLHESYPDIKNELAEVVNSATAAGGNIIVPSFAVERAQEVLYYMNELLNEDKIPNIMAVLDSPMAIRVTEVFKNHPEYFDTEMKKRMAANLSPFEFPGLTMTRTTRESKAINNVKGTMMIIAGSGMCTGGRVKHHLHANITRPESTILFVGYQAVGTLGRTIVQAPEEVRILGEKLPVKANIKRIHGFSAHADRDELFRWLSSLSNPPKRVFVIHGETDSAHAFRDFLSEKTGWDVSVPQYQQQVILD